MADPIDIQTQATRPKRITADGTTTEQHSLKDQLEANRQLAANKEAKRIIGGRRARHKHGGFV